MSEREEKVRGLLELARFLIDHPEVDIPAWVSVSAAWDVGSDASEATKDSIAIARINAWKATGLADVYEPMPGHYSMKVKFAGFELGLSYVEAAAKMPVAFGDPGEAAEDFQKRVDAARASAAQPEPCPSWAETDGIDYVHTYHRCQHQTEEHPDRHVCECGYEWYDFQAGDRT